MITQSELKSKLLYYPNEGYFIWLKLGNVAGSLKSTGYTAIKFKGKMYQAHRLAWLYVHGYMPKNIIDHINGNKSDNRICNLREATRSENNHNAILRKDSKSGVKGVHWCNRNKRWIASIRINKKSIYVGSFINIETAKYEIMKFREKHIKQFTNHGE